MVLEQRVDLKIAEEKDVPSLIQLIKQLGYEIDFFSLSQNLKAYDQKVIVARIDGNIVGFIAVHILPLFHSKEKQMRIVSLVVDGAFRKMGVGKLLMLEAEKIAKKEHCSAIELTSATHRLESGAHRFYHALGFASNGEKTYFRKNVN